MKSAYFKMLELESLENLFSGEIFDLLFNDFWNFNEDIDEQEVNNYL